MIYICLLLLLERTNTLHRDADGWACKSGQKAGGLQPDVRLMRATSITGCGHTSAAWCGGTSLNVQTMHLNLDHDGSTCKTLVIWPVSGSVVL